jgi:hypothetical protein
MNYRILVKSRNYVIRCYLCVYKGDDYVEEKVQCDIDLPMIFELSNIFNNNTNILLNTKHKYIGEMCEYIIKNNIIIHKVEYVSEMDAYENGAYTITGGHNNVVIGYSSYQNHTISNRSSYTSKGTFNV